MLNKKVLVWGGMLFAVVATASYVYGVTEAQKKRSARGRQTITVRAEQRAAAEEAAKETPEQIIGNEDDVAGKNTIHGQWNRARAAWTQINAKGDKPENTLWRSKLVKLDTARGNIDEKIGNLGALNIAQLKALRTEIAVYAAAVEKFARPGKKLHKPEIIGKKADDAGMGSIRGRWEQAKARYAVLQNQVNPLGKVLKPERQAKLTALTGKRYTDLRHIATNSKALKAMDVVEANDFLARINKYIDDVDEAIEWYNDVDTHFDDAPVVVGGGAPAEEDDDELVINEEDAI